MPHPIRALIVDDEAWARRRIIALLRSESDIQVVGEAADGHEAVDRILALHPDLVFLDVQMPGLDGFEVLQVLAGHASLPAVIFATAFEEYAVRAFDAHAVDYLLKPFDEERFARALGRARTAVRAGDESSSASLRALLDAVRTRRYLRWVAARSRNGTVLLPVDGIDWCEAADNYATIHSGGKGHLIRETMQGLEDKLDPDAFVRVHRSAIVNIARIREVQPWFRGEQVLIMQDGARVTVGRRYRERLAALLANAVR